jgi:xylan 1,4-beta-xylosidase
MRARAAKILRLSGFKEAPMERGIDDRTMVVTTIAAMRKIMRRPLGAMLLAMGILAALAEGSARATTYNITVDASKQTAGNPKFWSAAVGTGTASLTLRSDLETHYKIGNREAGFQRVRGHGVLNDDIGIYKGPGSYNWTNFDKYLTSIVSAGMRPVMEMDFMPTALALNGNSRDPYKSATDYKNFIQAIVQHCVDKYGMADVSQWYWEIWNEPDYPGFWNGKMADYYTLYDSAVSAITAVIPNALVGGPATTQAGPVGAFLQHCKSAGTRVTFASSHVYPGGASGGSSADAAGLLSDNNSRISGITGAGYTTSSVMSFNTEWNSSYSGQGGNLGDNTTSMDNHWNVGFILKGVKLLSDKNSGSTPAAALFSYWVLSDVFDESGGPSGSYILGKTAKGTLPFGQVFGLMTFQGIRKASFNAFKLLNYLGPNRLQSSGGTGSDGVDAMATSSMSGDELQILVYDYYAKLNTTGTDMVSIKVSNLPSTLAGKELFVTQFVVDEKHSNPYSVWTGQGSPSNPTEAQLQELKAAQHLALMQPVSTMMVDTSFSTSFTINRQAGTLLILGVKRPVTGRNALVTMEGEDYDGMSNVTKEDSGDADVGQSISASSGGSIFYDVVDFSDAGVSSVQLRVNAQAATNVELHADSATGTMLGKCAISATSGWETQNCALTSTSGVHTLYLVFGGAVRLNWLAFQQGGSSTGTGGTTGGGSGGGSGSPGTGGGTAVSTGGTTGSTGGATGNGSGGASTAGTGGSSGSASGGANGSGGGAVVSGTGGSNTTTGSGGSTASGSGGSTGTSGSGGSSGSGAGSGGSGASSSGGSGSKGGCSVAGGGQASDGLPLLGLALCGLALRRQRRRLA